MFLFYQLNGGEESWKFIEDTPRARTAIAEQNASFIAALSISETAEEADYEKVKYKGDLYFDIDSHDLDDSIKVVNLLIKKLKDLDVHDFRVYLSGKKGFHLTVPAKVFSKGAQVMYLPYIYGKMAEKMDVRGLDFSVYSGGRGRLWRQENVLRKETNTFKVEVDPSIIPTLTKEKYLVYVSSPAAPIAQNKTPKVSLALSEYYEYSRAAVIEEEKKRVKFEFEVVPELEQLKEVPGCILKLVEHGDQKEGSNFNKAAMQLVGYFKSSNLSEDIRESLIAEMAKNVKSGTYNTERSRIHHIKSHIRRAKRDKRMGFNPSFLFSTIEPCGHCILCNGDLDKYYGNGKEKDEDSEVEGSPIFSSGGCYFIRQGKFDRQITTFTMKALHYSEVFDEHNRTLERESTTVQICYRLLGEDKKFNRNIPESAWDSASSFKRAISGIDNVSWLGSESDIAHLKHYMFSKDVEMGRITKVKTCGIAAYPIAGTNKRCLVYVEPGYSRNSFNEIGTHELHNNVPATPTVSLASTLTDDERYVEIAKRICKINDPVKMALILGWFIACHYKPHFIAIEKQFPLLGLWGNGGSGKSKTASILSYLHGLDFEGEHSMLSCGGSTPWSIASYISTSTSTPRLIDEFNRSKLRAVYPKLISMFKDCFNENVHTKGQLNGRGSGAEVGQTKLTGPVVMMSEQFPEDEPPLIQRTVTVKLSRKSREGCEDDWKYVYDHRKHLYPIAKALVVSALKTNKKTINYWMEHYREVLPSETVMDSRPHYSFRVVLTGLKMYEITLKSYGIDVSKEIDHLRNSLLEHLNKNSEKITQSKTRSVVDDVIDVFAQMSADSNKNIRTTQIMSYGVGYVRDADTIWLDAEGCYSAYKVYMRSMGDLPVINSYTQFRSLLNEEEYFEGDDIVPAISRARTCVRLSVKRMKAKGISPNLFEYEDDDYEG